MARSRLTASSATAHQRRMCRHRAARRRGAKPRAACRALGTQRSQEGARQASRSGSAACLLGNRVRSPPRRPRSWSA
eukprot:735975-Prymnesium_polylepis.3